MLSLDTWLHSEPLWNLLTATFATAIGVLGGWLAAREANYCDERNERRIARQRRQLPDRIERL